MGAATFLGAAAFLAAAGFLATTFLAGLFLGAACREWVGTRVWSACLEDLFAFGNVAGDGGWKRRGRGDGRSTRAVNRCKIRGTHCAAGSFVAPRRAPALPVAFKSASELQRPGVPPALELLLTRAGSCCGLRPRCAGPAARCRRAHTLR